MNAFLSRGRRRRGGKGGLKEGDWEFPKNAFAESFLGFPARSVMTQAGSGNKALLCICGSYVYGYKKMRSPARAHIFKFAYHLLSCLENNNFVSSPSPFPLPRCQGQLIWGQIRVYCSCPWAGAGGHAPEQHSAKPRRTPTQILVYPPDADVKKFPQ